MFNIYIKMNGGRRPNQGQGTANQHKHAWTVTTDRLQAGKNGEFTTLTRVGADITSSLGMKTTTELTKAPTYTGM